MKKKYKIAIGVAIGLFIIMQFFQPLKISKDVKSEGDMMKLLNVPAHVAGLIEKSCYDCHSYNTKWPFYSKISPMSWIVVYDVETGRKNVNFSIWNEYSTMIQIAKLRLVCNAIETGNMPLSKYTMIHRDAKLKKEDIDEICTWVEKQIEIMKSQ
ncbi:MAG: heme-binding domain-containing protein [Candidatus Latescibacteria bacterium]|nr:heme-binding domain-containing protein [Candidatus Latescibacterota bacterium]